MRFILSILLCVVIFTLSAQIPSKDSVDEMHDFFNEVRQHLKDKQYQKAVDQLNQITLAGAHKIVHDDLMSQAMDGVNRRNYIADKNEKIQKKKAIAQQKKYDSQLEEVRRLYKLKKGKEAYQAAHKLLRIKWTKEAELCIKGAKDLMEKQQKPKVEGRAMGISRRSVSTSKEKEPSRPVTTRPRPRNYLHYKFSTFTITPFNRTNLPLNSTASLYNSDYSYQKGIPISAKGKFILTNLPDGDYTIVISTYNPDMPDKADYASPSAERQFKVVEGRFKNSGTGMTIR